MRRAPSGVPSCVTRHHSGWTLTWPQPAPGDAASWGGVRSGGLMDGTAQAVRASCRVLASTCGALHPGSSPATASHLCILEYFRRRKRAYCAAPRVTIPTAPNSASTRRRLHTTTRPVELISTSCSAPSSACTRLLPIQVTRCDASKYAADRLSPLLSFFSAL